MGLPKFWTAGAEVRFDLGNGVMKHGTVPPDLDGRGASGPAGRRVSWSTRRGDNWNARPGGHSALELAGGRRRADGGEGHGSTAGKHRGQLGPATDVQLGGSALFWSRALAEQQQQQILFDWSARVFPAYGDCSHLLWGLGRLHSSGATWVLTVSASPCVCVRGWRLQKYALDNQTLALIEVAVFAVLEGKRYEIYKKTGETGFLSFAPFDPMGMKSEEMKLKELKNGRLVRARGPVDGAGCGW